MWGSMKVKDLSFSGVFWGFKSFFEVMYQKLSSYLMLEVMAWLGISLSLMDAPPTDFENYHSWKLSPFIQILAVSVQNAYRASSFNNL